MSFSAKARSACPGNSDHFCYISEFRPQVARHGAAAALAVASTRDLQMMAALILAQSGDAGQAQKMSDDLARCYPLDTLVNGQSSPVTS